jgi:3-hydroxybutyryl-CoA dehydrogenase
MEIKNVCIVGSGLMGSGIAQICAQAGYNVTLRDIEQRFIDGGMSTITKNLSRDVVTKRMSGEEMRSIIGRIKPTLDLKEAAGNADVVVEAIVEVMEHKKKLFSELENIVPDNCLFFSNTSGLSITEMAESTNNPDKFIGTRFLHPVPEMKALEIISGYETSDKTLDLAKKWGEKIGKKIIIVNEYSAFAVNRILCTVLNEAFWQEWLQRKIYR